MRRIPSSRSALSSSRSSADVLGTSSRFRLACALTLGLLLSACTEVPAQGAALPITDPGIQPIPAPSATLNPSSLVFSGVKTDTSTPQKLSVENKGTVPLTVTSLTLSGSDAAAFVPDSLPAKPVTLAPGQQLDVALKFSPNGKVGVLRGSLNAQVQNAQPLSLNLSGLSALGLEGENEPPLAQVVQALGYSTDICGKQKDPTCDTTLILGTSAPLIGQEISAPLFRKTGSAVTLTPVARYSPAGSLRFGLFTLQGGQPVQHQVGVIDAQQYQTLNPALDANAEGNTSFDPGSESFGIYTGATDYSKNFVDYTLDSLNHYPDTKHAMRVYPLYNETGTKMPGYLIAVEASSNGDYQDAVFVLSGAEPVATKP